MSQDRWNDLYDRLTSRKLWLALLAIAFAVWNYHAGALSAVELQQAVTAAVITYTAAEGATDAVAAWRARTPLADQILALSGDGREALRLELERRQAQQPTTPPPPPMSDDEIVRRHEALG